MVKCILLPAPFEQNGVDNIDKMCGLDKWRLRTVIEPNKASIDKHHAKYTMSVALCTDGGTWCTDCGTWCTDNGTVQNGIKGLYKAVGIQVEVKLQPFSFVTGDNASMIEVLRHADIFWFAGVSCLPQKLKHALSRKSDETDASDLAAVLRERVQYGDMLYIGIRGGAVLASCPEDSYYECGLGLLQYLRTDCRKFNEVEGSAASTVQVPTFTEKYGIAMVVNSKHVVAVCFPVAKDAKHVWDTTSKATEKLQEIMKHTAEHSWACYADPTTEEEWLFNMQGDYLNLRTGRHCKHPV